MLGKDSYGAFLLYMTHVFPWLLRVTASNCHLLHPPSSTSPYPLTTAHSLTLGDLFIKQMWHAQLFVKSMSELRPRRAMSSLLLLPRGLYPEWGVTLFTLKLCPQLVAPEKTEITDVLGMMKLVVFTDLRIFSKVSVRTSENVLNLHLSALTFLWRASFVALQYMKISTVNPDGVNHEKTLLGETSLRLSRGGQQFG